MGDKIIGCIRDLGFNVDETLKRFLGNCDMYEKFLIKFLNDKNYVELGECINMDDYETAVSKAHTLKGLGGNLGLANVYNITAAMVTDMRAGKNDNIKSMYVELSREYLKVCNAIRKGIQLEKGSTGGTDN